MRLRTIVLILLAVLVVLVVAAVAIQLSSGGGLVRSCHALASTHGRTCPRPKS
jgi:preprotein translocase subunit SecG